MSSSQDSGTTSPGAGGQLEDAVTTFSDAVFEATQGLLTAQQQLTRTLLSGRGGQTQTDVDVESPHSGEHGDDRDQATSDDDLDDVDEADAVDDRADELDDEPGDEAGEVGDEADEVKGRRGGRGRRA